MPLPTAPLSLRSMCQLSSLPALFLRVKAKTALACLMALLRSASSPWRTALMASNAAEEGNSSGRGSECQHHRLFFLTRD